MSFISLNEQVMIAELNIRIIINTERIYVASYLLTLKYKILRRNGYVYI